MPTLLPKDFIVRAPTMADLEAVFNLVIACDIADNGEPDTTMDDLLSEWNDTLLKRNQQYLTLLEW